MLTAAIAGTLAAATTAAAGTRLVMGLLRRRGVLDMPNARSSHGVPTPRGGGVAIAAGALAGLAVQVWLFGVSSPGLPLVLALAGIVAVGFADDVVGLPAAARLILQGIFAAVVLRGVGVVERLPLPEPLDVPLAPVVAWTLSLMWIVGVTNIYNFLDGIDGYAAVQGITACLALALMQLSPLITPLLVAAGGACAGFLLYNWHPARIFMGDAGSTALGFLIAASPLYAGTEVRHQAVLITALTIWFFVSDGVYTLARRAMRGERFWQPHRTHLYQLFAAAGLRHDQVVRRVGSASAALAVLAAAAFHASHALFSWLVIALAVLGFLFYRWRVERMFPANGLLAGERTTCRIFSSGIEKG
jgi:UDP-N-acetylmuramyl pentapeptide phosphotransferase/UDP-N-acetylglucosamine-1-phosphate transferase